MVYALHCLSHLYRRRVKGRASGALVRRTVSAPSGHRRSGRRQARQPGRRAECAARPIGPYERRGLSQEREEARQSALALAGRPLRSLVLRGRMQPIRPLSYPGGHHRHFPDVRWNELQVALGALARRCWPSPVTADVPALTCPRKSRRTGAMHQVESTATTFRIPKDLRRLAAAVSSVSRRPPCRIPWIWGHSSSETGGGCQGNVLRTTRP